MNWYLIAAIILGALSAYFGYLGTSTESKSDSEEHTARIEGQLKELGNKIETLATAEPPHGATSSELASLQEKYNSIAVEFYKNFPLELEHQKNRTATKTIRQLEQSRRIEPHMHTLELAAQQLVGAFNKYKEGPPISVEIPNFPINVFEDKNYRIVLSFPNGRLWMVNFARNRNEQLELEFQAASKAHSLNSDPRAGSTGEYIALTFSEDQSTFDFYSHLSAEKDQRVVGDLPQTQQSIKKLDETTRTLLERIIKLEILEESVQH
ncbi:MAG: hypothetical protein P0119_11800 [Nitrospira sp.]|nr:hypothetical protein [Nitrospira sp.]